MAFAFVTAPVVEQVRMARDTYRIRVEAPSVARAIRPGQFVMVRLPQSSDPLLGRPFALYDTVLDSAGEPWAFDFVYLVVGKMTRLLPLVQPGDALEIWGPLGNGFSAPANAESSAVCVAGGIGQTPFLAWTRDLLGTRGYGGAEPKRKASAVTICYGVRTADLAAGADDFRAAGAEVHLASNDGSVGERGFVTDLAARLPAPGQLYGCGPEPMLHALAAQAETRGIPCQVSLETPMACGIGICFSCVTPVKTPTGWDYKRVCVDGPIFDASTLCRE